MQISGLTAIHVTMRATIIKDDLLAIAIGCPNLMELGLASSSKIDSSDVTFLEPLTRLRNFSSLDVSIIEAHFIPAFNHAALTGLTRLAIRAGRPQFPDDPPSLLLPNQRRIRKLQLNFPISVGLVKDLIYLDRLECLNLGNVLDINCLEALCLLPKLFMTRLFLPGTGVNVANVFRLAKSAPKLELFQVSHLLDTETGGGKSPPHNSGTISSDYERSVAFFIFGDRFPDAANKLMSLHSIVHILPLASNIFTFLFTVDARCMRSSTAATVADLASLRSWLQRRNTSFHFRNLMVGYLDDCEPSLANEASDSRMLQSVADIWARLGCKGRGQGALNTVLTLHRMCVDELSLNDITGGVLSQGFNEVKLEQCLRITK